MLLLALLGTAPARTLLVSLLGCGTQELENLADRNKFSSDVKSKSGSVNCI